MRAPSKPPRIAVVGELNVDLVASGLERAPSFGREVLVDDFRVVLGSASAVFACGAAKLGHEVTFVGKVGADDFGSFCLGELRRQGVRTRHVARDARVATGVTISLSSVEDRMLVTWPGAIATLRYADIPLAALKRHAHLHTTSYFLQTALKPAVARLHDEAHRLGLTTSFDPNTDPRDAWGDEIWQVIDRTDVLFVNDREAMRLTRRRQLRGALAALARRCRCAVVKLGPTGAVAACSGETVYMPGYAVACVDTTGAGDSFDAGFVSAFVEGRPLSECLERGNIAGALSSTAVGGTARQPSRTALDRFRKRNARSRNVADEAWLRDAISPPHDT